MSSTCTQGLIRVVPDTLYIVGDEKLTEPTGIIEFVFEILRS